MSGVALLIFVSAALFPPPTVKAATYGQLVSTLIIIILVMLAFWATYIWRARRLRRFLVAFLHTTLEAEDVPQATVSTPT